jgi:hypothetical protein
MSKDMNGTEDNVQCEEDHETNFSSSDQNAGNDYLSQRLLCEVLLTLIF